MINFLVRVHVVLFATVLGLVALLPAESQALSISYDEIIFQSGGTLDFTELSGTIDMTYSGNTLTIVLTNTSGDAGGTLAQNLLTGIGFNLPSGVTIDTTGSHSVTLTGGSSVSPSGTVNNTLWGYGNPATSGPFLSLPSGETVNVDLGTVQSMITNDLNNTSTPPANVAGPNYGMLSQNSGYSACTNGLRCVIDSLTFNIVLSGWSGTEADLLNFINSNWVVLSFGSPTTPVPEPSTLLLLGSGLIAVGLWGRMRRQAEARQHCLRK